MGGATAAALAFEKPPEKEVPPRTGSNPPPKPDPFAAAAPPAPSGFSNWGSPASGGAYPFATVGASAFNESSAFGDDASTAFR